jgi:hypothetical protein
LSSNIRIVRESGRERERRKRRRREGDTLAQDEDNKLERCFKNQWCQALVTHACNPSYSGGRDQEHHSSKPAWANSSLDPVLKIPNTKYPKKGW